MKTDDDSNERVNPTRVIDFLIQPTMKKEDQNKLRERWLAPEGRKLTRLISKGFRNGKLPALDLFGSHNARIDLRGLKLEPHSIIRDISLENVDLSFADLDNAWMERATFLNVSFMSASMQGMADHGNIFKDIDFTNTDLRLAVIGYNGSSYKDCTFNQTLFHKAGFIRAEFTGCVFHFLKKIDFNVSSFSNCKFSGTINDVWFRDKYAFDSDLKEFGAFTPNRMKNVDFSDANVSWLNFTGGISLKNIRFPSDDFIFYMDQLPRVLPLAKKYAVESFTGKDLEAAEIFFGVMGQLNVIEQPETIFTLRDYDKKGVSYDFLSKLKNCIIRARSIVS